MSPWVGDVTQPGREVDRAAVEIANSRITNVLHDGPATGSKREHGQPESFPGHFRYGSNQHLTAIKTLAETLKAESPDALKSVAVQRGFFGLHPPRPERFDLVENYKPKMLESWTAAGEQVTAPVLSNGLAYGSKFDAVGIGSPPLERHRLSDVPEAPRLPSGEVDMAEVCRQQNEKHGHVPQTGRSNITVGGIGPRLPSATSRDIDRYPLPSDFEDR
jgi:hypothetical protein